MIRDVMEHAIKNRLKVNIQMQDTPDDVFILFHPYAELEDFFFGISFVGIVEKHYASTEQNLLRRPSLKGLKKVEILEDYFTPDHSKWKNMKGMDFQVTDILLEA